MNTVSFGLILIGVLLNATAQLLLKAGVGSVGEIALQWNGAVATGLKLAFEPHILGGLACYVISVVVWILALSRVDVSIAYPMLSIGYVVNALAAWALLGESMNLSKLVGIGIIILGVFVLARS
ncbi:MAG TPA: SMR family transporter [Gammaproteobacteria bacterium]|nr:SMR family transporter [Gammaproteobacteria bacterium]